MNRHLPQPTFAHQSSKERRVFQKSLAVRHQHGHQAGLNRVSNNFDQLILPARTPIGVSHITSSYLQASTRSLEAPVSINLLLYFCERRDRHAIGIARQITMSTAERAVAGAGNKPTMGQVSSAELSWSL